MQSFATPAPVTPALSADQLAAIISQVKESIGKEQGREYRSDGASSTHSQPKKKKSSLDTTFVDEDDDEDDTMTVQILKTDFTHFKNS